MILYVLGDLFQSPAQVLVNTVNTVGVMGKGIALEFKRLYPDMFDEYRRRCETGALKVGNPFLYKSNNKWVLNFPTKRHWRGKSKVEYIEKGLAAFAKRYARWGIGSIAFPPLGCGNGGLDFAMQVQPIMHKYLAEMALDVFIYPEEHADALAKCEQLVPLGETGEKIRDLSFEEIWNRHLLRDVEYKERDSKMVHDPFVSVPSKSRDVLMIRSKRNRDMMLNMRDIHHIWKALLDHGYWILPEAGAIDASSIPYIVSLLTQFSDVEPMLISRRYEDLSSPKVGLQLSPVADAEVGPTQLRMPLDI